MDEVFYSRALRRVYRMMLLLAACGTLACLAFQGWIWALAFALGAVGSYFNFSWLHQVVEALGPEARPTRKRVFILVALRYLLLGLGGYVIVKIFGMNAIGALIALFVPVAAVLAEGVYQLLRRET